MTRLRDQVGGSSAGVTRRHLAAGVAAVGAFAATSLVLVSWASAANPPELNAPERVYTPVNTTIDFAGTDDISGDDKALSVGGMVEAGCNTAGPNYAIANCPRIQMSLGNADAGLLRIPGNTVEKNNVNADVIVAASGAVITEATDPAGGDSILFNFNGTTSQLNSTLGDLQFIPATDYEERDTADGDLPTLSIKAIQGDGSNNTDRFVTIKVEGVNDGPTIGVPDGGVYDAPAGATTSVQLSAVDNDMCNFTLCGLPFTNPGLNETDDEMLLVAWIPESNCGTFNWGGGAAFSSQGSATNTSVHTVLTNGAGLQGDQAAEIESSISPNALLLDLATQPSSPTDSTTVFAGVAGISSIRNALDGFDFDAPADDATCHVNVSLSDMGNNGMPKSYEGSAIGGPNETPEPGYEVPTAKGETVGLTFNVADNHPDVTISQILPSKAGDPLGPNKPGGWRITFSEPIEASSFDATDLSLSTSSSSGTALGALAAITPGEVYTVPVTATGDGTMKLTFTGTVYAAGHDGDAAYDNEPPTYDDNETDWDQTAPTATIAPWPGQPDPATAGPIEFEVTFSDTISTAPIGFDENDVDLGASTATGTLVATVTQPDALDLKTYKVSVAGMVGSGDVIAKVKADAIVDEALNSSAASSNATVAWDGSGDPAVTIDQAVGQFDPTSINSVAFTVQFSEPVFDFINTDVLLSGTAGATTATVTGSGANYTVKVSGMTQNGTIIATVPAGVAHDATNALNTASTSTDNAVDWVKPTASLTISTPGGMVTLHIASGSLTSFSTQAPSVAPPAGVTFPFGELSFTAEVVPGSLGEFALDLPSAVDGYYKLSSGAWAPFTWDGTTGAELTNGNTTVALKIQDDGRGDSNGTAGVITDPGAPALVDDVTTTTSTSTSTTTSTSTSTTTSTSTSTTTSTSTSTSTSTTSTSTTTSTTMPNGSTTTSTSTSTTVPGGSTTTVPGGSTTTVPGGSTTTVPGGSTTTQPGGSGSTTTDPGNVSGGGTDNGTDGTAGGELARTGSSNAGTLAGIGIVTVVLGALVIASRRRLQA